MKQSVSKRINKVKGTGVFSDEKKLQLAKDITRLRQYTADDIAQAFGTSRQAINYHMRKDKNEK